jgi:hypothetical protein
MHCTELPNELGLYHKLTSLLLGVTGSAQCPQARIMTIHEWDVIMNRAKVLERRGRPRVKNKWPVTLVFSDSQIEGEVYNISPLGAYICLEKSFPLEGSFLIVIKPPNSRTLSVSAEIIWTETFTSDDGKLRTGVGVKFVHISDADSQFLHDLVTSFYIV